jgi:acyl-CoA synthetase (AMP-forming)/AMP-acid ligase II
MGNFAQVIIRNARRFPDKAASKFGGMTMTYAELDRRLNRLVNGLRGLGIQRGDRVAFFARNCHTYLEGLFGAAKGGLTLVTINFMLKEKELSYILQHSDVKAIIFQSQFAPLVKAAAGSCPELKRFIAFGEPVDFAVSYEELLSSSSEAEPGVSIEEDDTLLLVYTSGTTGQPKGVMLSQRNVYSNAIDSVTGVELGQDTINLNVCPLYHVAASVLQTYTTFYIGGTSITLEQFDPQEVLQTIERERVNFTFLVPTMIFRILELPDAHQYDLSSLRKVGYGAAPMPLDRLKKAIPLFGPVLFQGYGLTESTANVVILRPEDHDLAAPEPRLIRLRSCGREHSNHEIRVVGLDDQELPPGEFGEIVLKSPSVMKGYWKNPQATGEALRGGWLHTGDMAYMDGDGYIYIVDRKNDLIISGGENIYPKEIEEVLFAHPSVLEAAVCGIPHPDWGEVPKAFVVLREGYEATAEQIIEHCRQNLAKYKCPKEVMFLEEIPKTASGKITRVMVKKLYIDGQREE